MSDTKYHVCHRCGGADKYVVPLFCGELEHRHWNDCIRTLKRQRDELRNLLAVAVDEYEKRGVLTAVWYRQSKKVVKT